MEVYEIHQLGVIIEALEVESHVKKAFREFLKEVLYQSFVNEHSHLDDLNAASLIHGALSKVDKLKDLQTLQELLLIKSKLEDVNKDIDKLKSDKNVLQEIIFKQSTSYESTTKIQTIPITIYLDINDPNLIFDVYTSVLEFLDSIGFEKAFEFDAIKGSWFKRMLATSKEALTSEEVYDRLREAEYGIEVNTILRQQSEVDKNQSEALLNILKSVESISNAAIRIGSLLVVKLTNKKGEVNVQVRSLSIKELHLLNKKPELLHNPQKILNALTREINGDE